MVWACWASITDKAWTNIPTVARDTADGTRKEAVAMQNTRRSECDKPTQTYRAPMGSGQGTGRKFFLPSSEPGPAQGHVPLPTAHSPKAAG